MEFFSGCRAICFDMDGTLLDTKVDTVRMTDAIFDLLEAHGLPGEALDRAGGYKTGVEKSYAWLKENCRPGEMDALGRAIRDTIVEIEMERVDEAAPFPGVVEMLKRARAAGYRTGVLTRGTRVYADAALEKAGVTGLLDAVVARDDYPEEEAKPDPVAMVHLASALGVEAREILFSGDHKYDWMCARDSSAKFVAVTSGTYSREDWLALDPEVVIAKTAAEVDGFARP